MGRVLSLWRGNLRHSGYAGRGETGGEAQVSRMVWSTQVEEITMEPNEPHIGIQLLLGCVVIFGLLAFFLAAAAG